MSSDQFTRALQALELTPRTAGALFRHDERTIRRWMAGDRGVPQGIAILLLLMVAGRIENVDVMKASRHLFD